jgi:hypothetical protein
VCGRVQCGVRRCLVWCDVGWGEVWCEEMCLVWCDAESLLNGNGVMHESIIKGMLCGAVWCRVETDILPCRQSLLYCRCCTCSS